MLEKVAGNSDYVLFQDNGRLEKERRDLNDKVAAATGVGPN